MQRIRCLLLKEIAQLRRDRRLMALLLVAPVIQLLVMGFAANNDVRGIALAVRDNDGSFHSREFIRALGASGYFTTALLESPAERDGALLVSGKAGLILVIPPDFSAHISRREPAPVQALVDGADSNFAVQGLAYLQKAARQYSEKYAPVSVLGLPSVQMETRIWFNPDLRSPLYLVPAIMGLVLMVTTMLVTSMALVKEREEGTLEQLIVTPLRPVEMVIGKLLPFVVIGFISVSLAIPVIVFIFGVPLRGSVSLLYGISGLLLLNTLGLGLFVSTLVKTQQQAMMVSVFFIMMPFVLLSGFAFPIANMPPVFQAVASLIPLKYYFTGIRGIFLKGAGLAELWFEATVLLVWGLSILTLAALKFRKRLD